MNKAKDKFNEYIKENVIEKVIVLKNSVICLSRETYVQEIVKRQKRMMSNVLDRVKYAPVIVNGSDIEKIPFYCCGVYDNRYKAAAEIEYNALLDNVYNKNDCKSTIFICSTTPEELQATASVVLDVLDDAYKSNMCAREHYGHKNMGEFNVDVAVGCRALLTPKPISTGVFLSHSKEAFNSIVLAVAAKAEEAEME